MRPVIFIAIVAGKATSFLPGNQNLDRLRRLYHELARLSVQSAHCPDLRAPVPSCNDSSDWPKSVEWLALWECLRSTTLRFHSFDESYLERLRAGDFRTEEHFVAYFSELIRLKLRSRLRSPQAIEDVRQETFVRVFTALRREGIHQPERLGAFVNSICNNVLLEHYRSSSRDISMEEGRETEIPDSALDVVGALEQQEMQEKVRVILDAMPERDRRILKEIFFEERDKDHVCRDFGVDRNYLRVLLHRAKQSFKSLYLKRMTARVEMGADE